MISDKRFVVQSHGQTSCKEFFVRNGLQQGTVNAPVFFNLYIFELLENIVFHADKFKKLMINYRKNLTLWKDIL